MASKINLKDALGKAKDIAGKVSEQTKNVVEKAAVAAKEAGENAKPLAKKVGEKAVKAKDKVSDIAVKGKNEIVGVIDQNNNGQIDIEDVIILGINSPGVKVDRKDFLKKELFKKYQENIIDKAIASTPMEAGINSEDIDKIADEIIKTERNIVSGISAALGAPGGAAMFATIPADIVQYYGCMLRVLQKLLYLYGFPQINVDKNGSTLDSETINLLTICLGVMYGVAGANNALKTIAKALATGVEKKLLNAALTKGTIYPIVKKTAAWFGARMTKDVFAGFFKNTIPVVGGVIGGGLTFVSFKPCCDRLKESLKDTRLANPNSKDSEDVIDIEIQSTQND